MPTYLFGILNSDYESRTYLHYQLANPFLAAIMKLKNATCIEMAIRWWWWWWSPLPYISYAYYII